MGTKPNWERRRARPPGEAVISAVAIGAVFVLLGLVFVLAWPNNLFDRTVAFFTDFTSRQVPGINITLPAPARPSAHTVFYTAVFEFSIGIAFLQVLILALRIGFSSPPRRIGETVGNLVFWFGVSYLEHVYLGSSTTIGMWWAFWAGVIIVAGLSFVARAVVLLAKR